MEKVVLLCDKCGGTDAQRVEIYRGDRRTQVDLCDKDLAPLVELEQYGVATSLQPEPPRRGSRRRVSLANLQREVEKE